MKVDMNGDGVISKS